MSIWSIHSNTAYQMPADIRQSQPGRVQSEPVREAPKDSAANAPPPGTQDRYDRDAPTGEPAEGIYSVERDEDGNTRIDYVEPRAREAQPQGLGPKAATPQEVASQSKGDAVGVGKESLNQTSSYQKSASHSKGPDNAKSSKALRTAHTSRDVQRLKMRIHRLQRQAHAETNLAKRASLEGKIQELSVEIAWKESEGYRRERAVAS